MSWDQYVTNLQSEGEGKLIKEVAIWGHEQGSQSVWAHSQGLTTITAEEIKILSGDLANAFTNGVKIAGNKCTLLRNQLEEEQCYCLTLSTKIDGNPHSVCVGKSLKAFVIALSHPGVKVGQMLPGVHKTVTHLRSVQY